MNFIDKLKADINFYEKHENSLLDEVKLQKLRDISNRIRGVSYVTGPNDERVIALREYVARKEKDIVDRIDSVTVYADGEPLEEPLLLSIILRDESSVPTVYYKGVEITEKVRVSFDWSTREDTPNSGGIRYNIEHYEKENEELIRKGVGLARGKYTI